MALPIVLQKIKDLAVGLRDKLDKSGGTMTGEITFSNGKKITDYLSLSGGTMTGPIVFSEDQKLPSGLVVGQIVESVLPLTDAGLHLLDGAKLPASGMYAEFYQHCQSIQASYPSLFVSESDWQSTFSTYGSCGKFVLDSDGVRLPSISNIVQGTSDLTQLGALVEAGLPNITANLGAAGAVAWQQPNGAFYLSGSNAAMAASSGSPSQKISLNLDASRSSSIYGNSTTVQPQTIKVLLYICVATSLKTPVEVEIDNVITDLNNKADRDLSNTTNPVLSAPYVIEEWHQGTEWYRAWSTGFIEQGGDYTGGSPRTVTFRRPFSGTDYSFIISGALQLKSKTATSFSFDSNWGNSSKTDGYWYACGY